MMMLLRTIRFKVLLASGRADSCPLHLYLPLLERAGHRQKVEAEQMVTFE
jgi:hypothetical protein